MIFETKIRKKTNPNESNRNALGYEGDLETMKYAIEKGANVDAKSTTISGWTPLHSLIMFSSPDDPELLERVKYLIENGADIDAKDDNGMTSLHFLSFFANMDKLTKKQTNKHELNQSQNSDIFDATKFVQMLVQKGADINATENGGVSILHVFAMFGN